MDQKVQLEVNIADYGEVTDHLTITRTNKMPNLKDTNNENFIRVLVPEGAQLLDNIGFDYKTLDSPAEDQNFKQNSDVKAWQSSMLKDVVSGTYIGQEAGKSFYGNWLNVEGGQSKTVELTYKLPFKISSVDHYSLMLQKQLGAQSFPIDLTINFSGRKIEWKNFDTTDLQTSSLKSHIDLNKDYLLGTVLSKNK
jgi:hypothetical protein